MVVLGFSFFYIFFLLLMINLVWIRKMVVGLISPRHKKHKVNGQLVFHPTASRQKVLLQATEAESHKRFSFVSNESGHFILNLPDGNYRLKIDGFGLKQLGETHIELSPKHTPTRIDIKVKAVEQVIPSPLPAKFIAYTKFLWLALSLTGFSLYLQAASELETTQSAFVVIISIVCVYLATQSQRIFFRVMDFQNKPLKSKKVKIKNSQNKTLANLPTDGRGRICLLASQGIYKIEADQHLDRAFRVNETSIIDLRLKL